MPAAHRKTRLAAALGSEAFEPVRVALAEGRLLVDQAQVIVAAVQALPADLDPTGSAADAQATLVGYAVHHDARELRILGNRILEVIAPEVGEAHEAKLLERRSGRRRRPRRSGWSRTGTGSATAGSRSPPCTGRC